MKLISRHLYRNKNPKGNMFINTIIPLDDIEVSEKMFNCFEDVTPKSVKDFKIEDSKETR